MHMRKWWFAGVLALVFAVGFAPTVSAQESASKGSMTGTVVDSTGGSIPGSTVTLTGPQGSSTATTNTAGGFTFQDLIPATYSVKVEMKNFRSAVVPSIEVYTGRNTEIRVTLEPGTITQTVEVVSSAVTVDTTSTAVASNLNDTFYGKLPIQRNVTSLFYIAPGVVSGGGTGEANPSISGATGLENMYIADGVSITDTAFGGMGIFSRVYGSLGTGINLSFVKEVQVKTAAFQPQYGGATGGIVQIVTKSGGHDYHGAISAYYQPQQFEAQRVNADDFGLANPFGRVLHVAGADLSGEIGGSVPTMRDKLFFFGSMDPSLQQTYQLANPASAMNALGELDGRTLTYNYAAKLTYKMSDKHSLEGSVFGDPSHTNRFPWARLTEGVLGTPNTTDFSKLEYGDRDTVARYNGTLSPTWVVNASVTWMHNKFKESGFDNSVSRVRDDTQTGGLPGQQGSFTAFGQGFYENTDDESYSGNINTSKIFNLWGQHALDVGYQYTRAFYKGGRANSGPASIAPAFNEDGNLDSSQCTPGAAPCPWSSSNANYYWRILPASALGDGPCADCPLMNVPGVGMEPVTLFMLRSEFNVNAGGIKQFTTHAADHVAYVNDAWTINKYVTINAGIRWQTEHLVGEQANYAFTDNWSPRIGVDVDPIGDRKNKFYFNFGRYNYNLPLDLAERSLTNETDLFNMSLAPAFTTGGSCVPQTIGGTTYNRCVTLNSFGSVTPIVDAAHNLSGATNGFPDIGVFGSLESLESIHSGTRQTYEDEYVFGAEHQFSHGVLLSARFIHRSLRRIVEDTGGISPEAALAGIPQQFSITNPSKSLDIFTNPVQHDITTPKSSGGFFPDVTAFPSDCLVGVAGSGTGGAGAGQPGPIPTSGPVPAADVPFINFPQNSFSAPLTDSQGNNAACFGAIGVVNNDPKQDISGFPVGRDGKTQAGSLAPDGIPDGFADPIHKYWAVEVEVNKAFSNNWQLRANYRISKLFGNFEGAFRNDNGQSDPGISSLFDFTPGNFGTLGDQFLPGVLNTDRQQVANGYFSYVFDHGMLKNLTLGTGVGVQTGTPINELAAHPVYQNAGEVPIGGRGSEGRTPTYGTVSFHGDYVVSITEKSKLRFGVDMFNVANSKRILFFNQNIDLGLGTPNLDFLKPANQAVRGDAIQSPFNARVFARFEF